MGSIPSAYIAGKSKNIDIRKHGSGNVGATNTFRVLGKKAGILVLIIDLLKGFVPVFSISKIIPESQLKTILLLSAGTMTILGHIFPIWLKFKGGKGIATACGFLIALTPFQILIAISMFFIFLLLTKIVSFSSIIAVSTLPFTFFLFHEYEKEPILFYYLLTITALLIVMHKSNIIRMIHGKEKKLSIFSN